MALADLVQPTASPFSDQERLDQTEKLIQRTFGVASSKLGDLAMQDGQPTLTIAYNGVSHLLTWQRDGKARIVWYINGKPALGVGGENALNKLKSALDNQ